MAPGSSNANAELLKAEGNALHQARKYKEAYAKYSEAIKQDPKNAVLWANRAASALSMKKYLDACTDAEKATQLDPKYTKAWGRQGTAYLSLGSWPKSVSAFQKALDCLPATGELSKADQVLKAQFEDGLKKAQANIGREFTPDHVRIPNDSNVPWKRAMALEPTLIAQRQMKSSEFQEGIDGMNELHTKVIRGQKAMVGRTGTNAWAEGGPRMVQEEAPKRLKTSGWGAVRPAITTTVRGWIMRGFLTASFQIQGAAAEFVSDALQILQWGARVWKNVPKEERGVIFETTFIRGVKRLYLNILVETYTENKGDLEAIAKVAREMIDEDQAPPQGEVDPGNLAWYYLQKARATSDYDEGTELCKESAAHYYKGAILSPKDDEKHVSFLKVCLDAHWYAGSPLKVTLPIASKIRESIQEVKKIWEYSADSKARDVWMDQVISFENHFKAEVEAGRMSLEASGGPEGMDISSETNVYCFHKPTTVCAPIPTRMAHVQLRPVIEMSAILHVVSEALNSGFN
ncbi:hypothetical protein DXG01_002139 [Tephrocybe rancida]|nr:hypothetical protein DXG01_002139 [Tephrocybe rancida]